MDDKDFYLNEVWYL